jgi:hypothetical protein
LENGRGIPKLLDVRELTNIYGPLPDSERERLLRWAREGRRQTWWQDFADVLTKGNAEFDRFVALENDATVLRSFEIEVVHGLLQIPEYSRAVMTALYPDLDSRDIDRLVEVRTRRRELLVRQPDPPRLSVVLDESVLHRMIGGPTTMTAQLRSLITDSRRSNIELRVLSFAAGAHIGLGGSFGVLDFKDEDSSIGYVENRSSTSYLEGPARVSEYAAAFDALVQQALEPAESSALIASMLHAD